MQSCLRYLISLLAIASASGCGNLVGAVTTERADWRFISERGVEIALDAPRATSRGLLLPMRASAKRDSAICLKDAQARLQDGRIALSLHRSVCGVDRQLRLEAILPSLAAREYIVVYDDPGAGFPVVGKVKVQ